MICQIDYKKFTLQTGKSTRFIEWPLKLKQPIVSLFNHFARQNQSCTKKDQERMVCLCLCSITHNHYLWISVDFISLLPLVLIVCKRHFPWHLLVPQLYLCLECMLVSSCSKHGRLWLTFTMSRTAQPGEGVGEGITPKKWGLKKRIWAGRWEEKEARCFKEKMKKGRKPSRGRGIEIEREGWM